MESSTRFMITLVALVALIAGLYLFSDWFSKTTGYVLGEDQQIRLVQCLNEKNSVFYTMSDCVDCFRQQELFADRAFEFLQVLSCDDLLCENLVSIPAWEIDGKFYYGTMDFNQLSDVSGCEIENEKPVS
ncbi:MAG: hypothetical protein AABW79_01680 [Nanoarchaeota archaeon]